MKNERTSKRVASKAGKLIKRIQHAEDEIMCIEREAMTHSARVNFILPMVRGILKDAKAIAASALTQTPDKPKGKRK
jgi:hypothetical protein